jgi:serine/threonine protein phosphatase PrpC
MASLRWGAATHEGQVRTQNEDHHHATATLFVVADGMGGHLAGEVASEMAVQRLDSRMTGEITSTRDDLVSAISEANVEIYNASVSNPDQAGMGTTITALAVIDDMHDGEVFAIANVGDSRGYVLRHNRLRQVTIDHSFVQELVAEGAISRDEARSHPRRNIVTRALGIEPFVRVDSWTMPIVRGDRFVLCSDGLVDEVPDSIIEGILIEHPDDPVAAAQALVDAANDAGGRDNVTVLVVDVLEGDDPPDATEEFDVVPTWSELDLVDTAETQIVADPLDGDAEWDDDGDGTRPATVDGEPTAAAPVLPPRTDGPPAKGDKARKGDKVDKAARKAAKREAKVALKARRRATRGSRIARNLLVLGFAAVVVLGFAIFAAWARSGYFVAFDDDGRVSIFQGRRDGVLWFEPTREAPSVFQRDQLDDQSIGLVEQQINFDSEADAADFINTSLQTTTTTSTTTTTTTTSTTSTTTTSTTVAPSTTAEG